MAQRNRLMTTRPSKAARTTGESSSSCSGCACKCSACREASRGTNAQQGEVMERAMSVTRASGLRRRTVVASIGCALVTSGVLGTAASSRAAVVEAFAVDQHGDFALIGNTLAQDCAAEVAAPTVGDVGNCGAQSDDTGADVLWSVAPDGAAVANVSIDAAQASSVAVLALPAGATVTHAELFWSALAGAGDATSATLAHGASELGV